MQAIWGSIKTWAENPFRSNMTLAGWLLFVGLILVAIILWTRVLAHIFEGVSKEI